MSAASPPVPLLSDLLRTRTPLAGLLGLAAGLVLLAWALLFPAGPPGAGWLIGLVFWLGIALGSLALLAIHALTGGHWGENLGPALRPAAASLPLFLVLAVPLLPSLSVLYPWVRDPSLVTHPDVARFWLNPSGFALRGVAALATWSVLAVLLLALRGAARTVVAALGLALHLVFLTVMSVDWVLSLDPRFRSTAFPMQLLTMQLLAALAWAATFNTAPAGEEPGQSGDLAGLIFATALGALYLGFSQYLVAWYGDLPDKSSWFLERQGWGWGGLLGVATLLSAALPLVGLLFAAVRRSPAALSRLGPPVLGGLLLHLAWIVGPPFGAAVLPAALLGTLAVGGLWLGLAYGPLLSRFATEEAPRGA